GELFNQFTPALESVEDSKVGPHYGECIITGAELTAGHRAGVVEDFVLTGRSRTGDRSHQFTRLYHQSGLFSQLTDDGHMIGLAGFHHPAWQRPQPTPRWIPAPDQQQSS